MLIKYGKLLAPNMKEKDIPNYSSSSEFFEPFLRFYILWRFFKLLNLGYIMFPYRFFFWF